MGRWFLLPLYIIVFLAYLGYSSMITVFTPMMMRDRWGMVGPDESMAIRMTWLGILLALYPMGQFFGSPILIALTRRFEKKRVLLFSLFLTALAYAWLGLALEALRFWLVMCAVFLAGFFEANESIAEDLIAEIALKKHHSRLMSYLHVSSSGAFLAGPILSGVLSIQYGLAGPFWGICCCLAAAFFLTLLLPNLPPVRRSIEAARALKKQIAIFSVRRFHFAFAINCLIYFAIFGFFRAYPMHLVSAFNLDILSLSYYIAWVAVPIVLANLGAANFLIKRFSAASVLTCGSFGIGVFMLLFAVRESTGPWVLISLFLVGLSIGICLPASPVFIARSAHRSILSEVLESDLGILKGAETFASLSGGALAAVFIQLPLLVFAAIALICSLWLGISKRPSLN